MAKEQVKGQGEVVSKGPVATVTAPNFLEAVFEIEGDDLVIHRFSQKTKMEMDKKRELGSVAGSRKNREPKKAEDLFNEARYQSAEGWDGMQASAFRTALIDACRLVNLVMTKAKMSIFIVADGRDVHEPQIPLVRIYAKPTLQRDVGRVETGTPYVTVRPAYHNWKAKVRVRWDGDQFTAEDVANLMMRVGQQIGIGEGRPYSKKSAGMGWGTFRLTNKDIVATRC